MTIDPKTRQILDFIASREAPPIHELSPAEARLAVEKSREIFSAPRVELPRVESLSMPGPGGRILLRLYSTSAPAPGSEGLLPVLLFYHGGGWVVGSLAAYDDVCRRLARESDCLVIAVDYRLAPEHKYPAAVEDAVAALEWTAQHAKSLGGDGSRLAVGGDSAGANLAAVVAQTAHRNGGPVIAHQLLVYPVTTHDFSSGSMQEYADGYLLTRKGMEWFWEHYLNDPAEAESPEVSPLKAGDLAGLPPTHVVTAEIDILRDEGEAYARKLEEAGVPVVLTRCNGMIHGFLSITVSPRTNEIIAEIGDALKKALNHPSSKRS